MAIQSIPEAVDVMAIVPNMLRRTEEFGSDVRRKLMRKGDAVIRFSDYTEQGDIQKLIATFEDNADQ